ADELSIGAANALLKTLEEPRAGTHFVLLSSRGDRLLNTIRSRTMPIRFAPLPDDVIRGILKSRNTAQNNDLVVELAAGSASAACELADAEQPAERDEFVKNVLAAVDAKDFGAAVAFAEGRERDKPQMQRDLRALGAALARAARASAEITPREAKVAAQRYE